LFRRGEAQISLVDLGPASRDGMAHELRAAEAVWRSGRHRDAAERIRELRAPLLTFATSDQRAEFWRPWTDATYPAGAADPSVGDAFPVLIDRTRTLGEVSPDQMLEYVLTLATDQHDREVVVRNHRHLHGRDWIEVETWNRVSHQDRSRIAYLEDDGYLLVLAMDRVRMEHTGLAFEALLASFDVTAPSAR
jgi:hypothetical protein